MALPKATPVKRPYGFLKEHIMTLYKILFFCDGPYGSFLFASLSEGEQGWVSGEGRRGKILEEALLRGVEGVLGVWAPVEDYEKSRQGAGRPSVVLGPERPTHSRHNNK